MADRHHCHRLNQHYYRNNYYKYHNRGKSFSLYKHFKLSFINHCRRTHVPYICQSGSAVGQCFSDSPLVDLETSTEPMFRMKYKNAKSWTNKSSEIETKMAAKKSNEKSVAESLSFEFIKPILPDMDFNYTLNENDLDQLNADNQEEFTQKLDFCNESNIKINFGTFQSTRYVYKFTIDFEFTSGLNINTFWEFMCKLETKVCNEGVKVEFCYTTITTLRRELQIMTEMGSKWKSKKKVRSVKMPLQEMSIGSLVNLGHFARHIGMDFSNFAKYWNFVEFKFDNNRIYLEFHIRGVLFNLEVQFSQIQRIVLHIDRNAIHLVLEVLTPLYLAHCSRNSFEFMRINDYNSYSRYSEPVENWEHLDTKLHAMARAYCITIPTVFDYNFRLKKYTQNPQNQMLSMCEHFFHMAQLCKEINKSFTFYLGSVRFFDSTLSFDRIYREILKMFYNDSQFSIFYACLVFFSKNYTVSDQIYLESGFATKALNNFLELVHSYYLQDASATEECLYTLEVQCRDEIVNVDCEFHLLMHDYLKYQKRNLKLSDTTANNNELLVRRAILTPSHLYFERPIFTMKSRFNTLANSEYILRLTVLEDNLKKISKLRFVQEAEFIRETFMRHLLDGIEICRRKYFVVGSSSSQMRDNGVYMYANDDQGHDHHWIHKNAGDLSKFFKNSTKYLARFGLIFSNAITQVNLFDYGIDQLYQTDDVERGDKPGQDLKELQKITNSEMEIKQKKYNFSDGIGLISENLQYHIAQQLKIGFGYIPSAFQIRNGGCKGMLTAYPKVDKNWIIIRKSMVKFLSKDSYLGILKYSFPRAVFLNRPLIMILDQVGVPPSVFYKYFANCTNDIANGFLTELGALSINITYRNQFMQYVKLARAGVSMLHEPFFRRVLCYIAFYRLYELRQKARIKVAEENGRHALGVLDESQKLQYGEIFFQYTVLDGEGNPTNETHILDGQEVMITKFPCLQPGDVRKFKAVNIEDLNHIKDCVVFPQSGPRPHPDEMAGSDLDGDEYAIFWESDLIFRCDNYKPMNFPCVDKKEKDSEITWKDNVAFLTDYFTKNNIGHVGSTHLIYADLHPKGLHSEECEELAMCYSIALDYQKTGVDCKLPEKYLFTYNSLKPDFTKKKEQTDYQEYLSKRILGQFYRQCCLIEEVINLAERFLNVFNHQMYSKPTAKLVLPGWQRYKCQAEEAFWEYKSSVIKLMEMFRLDSEITLLTDVYENRKEICPLELEKFFLKFNDLFALQAENLDCNERALLASAWYSICFEPHVSSFKHKGQSLLGLPWTVPGEIIKLLKLQKVRQSTLCNDENDDAIQLDVFTALDSLTVDLTVIEFNEDGGTVINATLQLAMSWITRINERILHRSFKVITLSGQNPNRITESDHMQKLVKNCLIQLYRKQQQSQSQMTKSGRTLVCFLFNQFMHYLFNLCNSVNESIEMGQLAQLLLLRYGIFSLAFVNQVDKMVKNKQNDDQLSDDTPPLIEQSEFDSLVDNLHLAKANVLDRFFLLQPNTNLDLKTVTFNSKAKMNRHNQKCFEEKLRFLTGASSVKVFYKRFNIHNRRLATIFKKCGEEDAKPFSAKKPYREIRVSDVDEEKEWKKQCNEVYYAVEANGVPVTHQLLRCLLGHPHFAQIYNQFNLE